MAKPEIHLIAAQTRNFVIGRNNTMPWHLPRDLAHFKTTTMGYPIIMGRNTYQSLGKALPNRPNHVITRQTNLILPDAQTHHSLENAISACAEYEKIFIIGGGELYRSSINIADELNITWIDTTLEGDCFFPHIDPNLWQEISQESAAADEKNPYNLQFSRYRRYLAR